jgi:hypothetical protein
MMNAPRCPADSLGREGEKRRMCQKLQSANSHFVQKKSDSVPGKSGVMLLERGRCRKFLFVGGATRCPCSWNAFAAEVINT